MASIAYQLTPQLSCHAWTADKLHLAVCPNNHEIYVYRKSPTGQWTHTHTLSDHDQLVSGLDWSTGSNQLVSCSHDRNSYVFSWQDQTLKPEMVITRLSKAATCVKWSPCQRKFAIGSAAKAVCICYYEQESHWWASKLIRKQHDSSILMVAWHPDSILLATASSDSKCRVFSTALPGIYLACLHQEPVTAKGCLYVQALLLGHRCRLRPAPGWLELKVWRLPTASGQLIWMVPCCSLVSIW